MPDTGRVGAITLAFGSPRYLSMAIALARSIKVASPSMPLSLVTDQSDVPSDLFDQVISYRPEFGSGLVQKLSLDLYSPYERTLFIDSDCLVVRDLTELLEKVAGYPFTVCGSYTRTGQWFGADISELCDKFGFERGIPQFNGGVMYWDIGLGGESVLEESRSLVHEYEALGFGAFRGGLPVADEPLVALAMAKCGARPFDDQGALMRTPLGLRGPLRVDVALARSTFQKGDKFVRPAIVHFCGPHAKFGSYLWEVHKLSRSDYNSRTQWLLKAIAYRAQTLLDRGVFWDAARASARLARRLRRRGVA